MVSLQKVGNTEWYTCIKGRILLFIFSPAIHFGKRITQWATLLSLYTNAALNLKDTYYGSNVTLSAFFQDSNEKTAKMDIYLPFSTAFYMAFSWNNSLKNSKLQLGFFSSSRKILIIQCISKFSICKWWGERTPYGWSWIIHEELYLCIYVGTYINVRMATCSRAKLSGGSWGMYLITFSFQADASYYVMIIFQPPMYQSIEH